MNKATQGLIAAMNATKLDNRNEENRLLFSVARNSDSSGDCVLDLPAILEALMEIVVGERCIAVPVWEVEAMADCRKQFSEQSSLTVAPLWESLNKSCRVIAARLHEPKVDHVETLKAMLDHKRQHRLPPPNDEKQEIAALEAAIKKMEQP